MDIKSLNRKELERLRAKIDKQFERLAKEELKAARDAAEKAAKAFGYSLTDLTAGASATKAKPVKATKPAKAKQKVAPKYRNPEDATQTWSGRGRQPVWFRDAIEAGKTAESLAI